MQFLALFLFSLINYTCRAQNNLCSSSCGKIINIGYPFRLKTDPKHCGDKRYSLSCENNQTILYLYSGKYIVEAINYNNYTIQILDSNVQRGNCSSLPSNSLGPTNFSYIDPYEYDAVNFNTDFLTNTIIFVNCENQVRSPIYIATDSCKNGGLFQSKGYSYVIVKGYLSVSEMVDSCFVELMAMISAMGKNGSNTSYIDIHKELANGIELSWLKGSSQHPTEFAYRYLPLVMI
ncbi:hypothetical protein UlMin_024913, partial [Ulmus minor]